MFINNFDPVAFQVLSIEIRWYSLSYIGGILIGWILSKKLFISDQNIRKKFDDFVTYVIVGIIVGGRLGYVLFTIIVTMLIIYWQSLKFGREVCHFMEV